MSKNIIIFLVIAMLLSGCDYVRRVQFMDLCSTNPSDEAACKCIFKAIDKDISRELGASWVYRPDLGNYPQVYRAIAKAERQCVVEYYPGN